MNPKKEISPTTMRWP